MNLLIEKKIKNVECFISIIVWEIILNQALLRLCQTSSTHEALRNYQKVIKSLLRDASCYFGFIKYNLVADLQIPRVLSFELKNDVGRIYTNEELEIILNRLKIAKFLYVHSLMPTILE